MKRIGVKYAREGMTMGWPVYNMDGRIILDVGDELDAESVLRLEDSGVGEVIVEDLRVLDVPVELLIPPAEEALLVHGLSRIMAGLESGGSLHREYVESLVQSLHSMIGTMSGSILGEPSAAGCLNVDRYDLLHPASVAGLVLALGIEQGMEHQSLVCLGTAALLMNIGYCRLPEGALMVRGPLPAVTWKELREHPVQGAEIVSTVNGIDDKVVEAIAHSHERYDGTGYPAGLKGDDISYYARLIAIVDTFYALVSRRPYRDPLLPHEAIEFIMAYSMELFDPELVELFSRKVPLYSTGVGVKLNSNETGIVADANLGLIGRPVVRVLVDRLGADLKKPYEVNLAAADRQRDLIVEVLDY